MKKFKCKYCKTYFNNKDYLEADEKDTCFSCRINKKTILCFAQVIEAVNPFSKPQQGKASKNYWSKKLYELVS